MVTTTVSIVEWFGAPFHRLTLIFFRADAVIEHQRIYGESINYDANDFERIFMKSF
jgi:hypothetical protein